MLQLCEEVSKYVTGTNWATHHAQCGELIDSNGADCLGFPFMMELCIEWM